MRVYEDNLYFGLNVVVVDVVVVIVVIVAIVVVVATAAVTFDNKDELHY